jgi:hypothetical protein
MKFVLLSASIFTFNRELQWVRRDFAYFFVCDFINMMGSLDTLKSIIFKLVLITIYILYYIYSTFTKIAWLFLY